MLDMEAIKARLAAAPRLEWMELTEDDELVYHAGPDVNGDPWIDELFTVDAASPEEAAFVAGAWKDTAALVAEVEQLREAWVDGKMREDRDHLLAEVASLQAERKALYDEEGPSVLEQVTLLDYRNLIAEVNRLREDVATLQGAIDGAAEALIGDGCEFDYTAIGDELAPHVSEHLKKDLPVSRPAVR